ncbi:MULTISPECIES: restriction endonuclease subunit S [unclassified Thioalkalivibrio]|uniref:restriction endonuclease subunit S n=1 Tax=unclassified Thioalkalivibrio TaxID=2621013 RepID=UPI0009D96363|nr:MULTISPECIES: restriction endonuclease subunit S [unclassified Thioalkalivibrio]
MSFPTYPEYKNSGVEWLGEVPAHWTVAPLKRCATIYNGKDHKDVETEDGDFPVIGSGGEFSRACNYLYDGESILLGRKGTIDKPLYVNGKFWTVDTMFYSIASPQSNGRFLYYSALKIPFSMYSTNTALPSMTQESLSGHLMAIPPLVEQATIASFLDHETAKIDALIEEQRRLIDLLKEKRQAVISHAVTKGLDPNAPMKDSGVEWLGEVPAHWRVVKVKHAAKLESGHTPSKANPEYWDGGIPWVSLNDSKALAQHDYIANTRFSISSAGIENSSARMLPPGAVVFTRDATIGLAAITTKEMSVSQHLIAWLCHADRVLPEYLLLVFYSMQGELERNTFGATLKTIGMPDIRRLWMPLPPLSEQRRIVDSVFQRREKLSEMIEQAENGIQLLHEHRSALISAAVTGKIDVRGWRSASTPAETDYPKAAEDAARYG